MDLTMNLCIPILYLAARTNRSSFKEMLKDIYSFIRNRFFVGEVVGAYLEDDVCIFGPIRRVILQKPHLGRLNPPASSYCYEVERNDHFHIAAARGDVVTVPYNNLKRLQRDYSAKKVRLFLKKCVEKGPGEVFRVKPSALKVYGVEEYNFDDLFTGNPPNFSPSKNLKKSGPTPSTSKIQAKTNNNKKQKAKKGARKLAKEDNKEKVVNGRLQAYLKEWQKVRGCLDLKGNYTTVEDCGMFKIHPKYFEDIRSVLEFVYMYADILKAEHVLDNGLDPGTFPEVLLIEDYAGMFSDLIQMFMTAIFSLQDEAEDYDEEDGIEELTGEVQVEDEQVTTEIRELATKASKWSQTCLGTPLSKLPLEPTTVTEVLRLYFLSSGAMQGGYRQRGGYNIADDAGIQLQIHYPDVLRKLSTRHVANLSSEDKLLVLKCLMNQVLSYATVRDVVEKKLEEYRNRKQPVQTMQQLPNRRKQFQLSLEVPSDCTVSEVLEMKLRDSILELEDKIFYYNLGSIKAREEWRSAISAGEYEQAAYLAEDRPELPDGDTEPHNDNESEMPPILENEYRGPGYYLQAPTDVELKPDPDEDDPEVVRALATALLQVSQCLHDKYRYLWVRRPLDLDGRVKKVWKAKDIIGDFETLERWKVSLMECKSFSQIFLHLLTFDWSVAWCESFLTATCGICKSNADLKMLMCDGCNKGYHTSCLKLKKIPAGDWYCEQCKPQEQTQSQYAKEKVKPVSKDSGGGVCGWCGRRGQLASTCPQCLTRFHAECAINTQRPTAAPRKPGHAKRSWICDSCLTPVRDILAVEQSKSSAAPASSTAQVPRETLGDGSRNASVKKSAPKRTALAEQQSEPNAAQASSVTQEPRETPGDGSRNASAKKSAPKRTTFAEEQSEPDAEEQSEPDAEEQFEPDAAQASSIGQEPRETPGDGSRNASVKKSAPKRKPRETLGDGSRNASVRKSTAKRNRQAYDLEERRIAAEERIADSFANLEASNTTILSCLQQLVGLLQKLPNSQI